MTSLRDIRRMWRALETTARAATFDWLKRVPASPLMVYVEVTRRCNMRCQHCDIWMAGQKEENLAAREVPAERLISVLSGLAQKGLLAVDLFGGEPLLRRDLGQIVRGLKRAGLHVTVTTNGALLVPERCRELLDAGLDQLLVSIDGPNAETHDAIRGREGTFRRAMEGLSLFSSLSEGRARTGINTLVCRPNLSLLPMMPELAHRVGAQQLRLLPYHQCYPFNQFTQDDSLMPQTSDLGQLAASLREVIMRARELGLSTNGKTYLDGIENWYRGKPLKVRCQAGMTVCDINGFGDVYPCYTLAQPAGNIMEEDFDTIWKSVAMTAHRRESDRCDKCWQSCYIEPGLRLSLNALWADREAVLHDIGEYFIKK